MNDFTALSAESEVSALAFVQSQEVYALDAQPALDAPAPRPLNIGKLVYHNLGLPFDKRVSRATLEHKRKHARRRGMLVALAARIHAECEPARAALRQAEAQLEAL